MCLKGIFLRKETMMMIPISYTLDKGRKTIVEIWFKNLVSCPEVIPIFTARDSAEHYGIYLQSSLARVCHIKLRTFYYLQYCRMASQPIPNIASLR